MKALLKPTLSTSLVVFFGCILLILGLFAEVFEGQGPEVDLAQIYANPVPVDELVHLKSLRLTNKHGTFLFENTHPEGNLAGPWQMLEPQNLKVKGDVINKIVEALNIIRVRNFHPLEPINVSSFSLDNPTLGLLFTSTRGKVFEIKMGLINPIDNSAYLSLSSQNQIYQIDPIELALESYDLSQLSESKIFALNPAALASVEIYGQKGLELKLTRKENDWFDQNGLLLSGSKVTDLFNRIEDSKSLASLDNLNTLQREQLERVMAAPLFGLKLISSQGIRSYFISESKQPIPGLVIPADSLILSSDEKQSFILISKEMVKIFGIKSKELK
jgi:hypothetical protein